MLDSQHPHSCLIPVPGDLMFSSDLWGYQAHTQGTGIPVGKTLIKKKQIKKKSNARNIFPSVLLVSDTTEREVGIMCQREAQVKNRCYLSKTGTGLHKKAGTYREWGQECTACGDKGARINALITSTPFCYENSVRKVGMSFALVSSGFLSVSRAVCDSESQALESWGHTWPHRLSYATGAHDMLCLKAEPHIYFAEIFLFKCSNSSLIRCSGFGFCHPQCKPFFRGCVLGNSSFWRVSCGPFSVDSHHA